MANVDCTPELCSFQRKTDPSTHFVWVRVCRVVFSLFSAVFHPFYCMVYWHHLPFCHRTYIDGGGQESLGG